MTNQRYRSQSILMLRILPHILQEPVFALKGGTAINFFVRDMPRLSVDIDLSYTPIAPRDESIKHSDTVLNRFTDTVQQIIPSVQIFRSGKEHEKVVLRHADVQVKIEPNLVFRGTVFPVETRTLSAAAQKLFEMYIEARTLSLGDLYGSKLCAALDRQHPRDIFDALLLLRNEGITTEVRKAFIVYLISHNRPMHELLSPNIQDMTNEFESEFRGMTDYPVTYRELHETQKNLPRIIRSLLTDTEKEFMVSIKRGEPEWGKIDITGIEKLPAVQWKIRNIENMSKERHRSSLEQLKRSLYV